MGTKDTLTRALDRIWRDRVEPEINMWTGREGAVLYHLTLQRQRKERELGRSLTDVEAAELQEKVNAECADLEEGMYEVGAGGVKYLGMYDASMKDGVLVIQRSTGYYLEEWESGFRRRWKKISEARYREIIAEAGIDEEE